MPIPTSRLYIYFISKVKKLSTFLYNKTSICHCKHNDYCFICWGAMEDAFEKEYARREVEGTEDYLEAKEFMWKFFSDRETINSIRQL